MPKRIALTGLNARSIDIVNVIRQNASSAYQNTIPEITKESELPAVGESLAGNPSLQNEFINALVNRIALVKVKSATFNNAYAELKKGMLEYGETVEEVFVQITKARPFSVEKAEQREFKRSLPDVRSAFHIRNWRVQYPVTIQDDDLRTAFLTPEGVTDLIAKIVDSVVTAAEYDEFLLFKYLLIKAFTKNEMATVVPSVAPAATLEQSMKAAASTFRGVSNKLTFMSSDYNNAGVKTVTKKDDQYIFMSAEYNAEFDVNVLASAFNMDKAEFMGHLKLIDDFTTFDNERFSEIIEFGNNLEPVTAAELEKMSRVLAIIVDKEWFQIYDNLTKFTEKYVASGLYWNYFYNIWKTVSTSPFSNCVAVVSENATEAAYEGDLVGLVTSVSFFGIDETNGMSSQAAAVVRFYEPASSSTDENPVPDLSKPVPAQLYYEPKYSSELAEENRASTYGIGLVPEGGIIFNPSALSDSTSASVFIVARCDEGKYAGVDYILDVDIGRLITAKSADKFMFYSQS